MIAHLTEFTQSKSPHCLITLKFNALPVRTAQVVIEGLGFDEGPVTPSIRRKKVNTQIQDDVVIVAVHYEHTNEGDYFDTGTGNSTLLPDDMQGIYNALRMAFSIFETEEQALCTGVGTTYICQKIGQLKGV